MKTNQQRMVPVETQWRRIVRKERLERAAERRENKDSRAAFVAQKGTVNKTRP